MLYKLYYAVTCLAAPFLPWWSKQRLRAHKEDALRWPEKIGQYTPQGWRTRPIWIHAVSVGELNAALPLIAALHAQNYQLLVSTSTRTSAALAASHLPKNVLHVYAPWDTPAAVRAFLDVHKPQCGILIDSELWPNLLLHAAARHIPLLLANARMSDKSLRRRLWLRSLYKPCLACFSAVFAPNFATAQRFKALGAANVAVIGSLKSVATPNKPQLSLVEALKPLQPWTAMSLHAEDVLLMMQTAVLLPKRLCIAVPRHMSTVPLLQQQAEALGLRWALRSAHATPPQNTQVYIADTMGESATWYSASSAAYIGKSTTAQNAGGHNPVEAIRFGCVALHGAHVHNFAHEYASLQQHNAAIRVESAEQLCSILQDNELLTYTRMRADSWLQQQDNPLPILLQAIARVMQMPQLQAAAQAPDCS